jgi:hypothetical protein
MNPDVLITIVFAGLAVFTGLVGLLVGGAPGAARRRTNHGHVADTTRDRARSPAGTRNPERRPTTGRDAAVHRDAPPGALGRHSARPRSFSPEGTTCRRRRLRRIAGGASCAATRGRGRRLRWPRGEPRLLEEAAALLPGSRRPCLDASRGSRTGGGARSRGARPRRRADRRGRNAGTAISPARYAAPSARSWSRERPAIC